MEITKKSLSSIFDQVIRLPKIRKVMPTVWNGPGWPSFGILPKYYQSLQRKTQ